jgi:O-antigen ligase
MQVTNSFQNANFSPSKGTDASTPDIASQLRSQQIRHRRILLLRTLGFWWYRVLLVLLGCSVATILGQFAPSFPAQIFGGIVMLPLLFLAVRRLEFGLLLVAFFATAYIPKAFSISSLDIYPVVLLLLLLLGVVAVQLAFRTKEFVLPSFWFIWPHLALILVALVSNLMIQVNWIYGVSRLVSGNPIYYHEIIGIALFLFPLICLIVTTASLTNKDQWVEYLQRLFVILALLAALLVIFDFIRLGANIYTYRFIEKSIGWMPLANIAQLLGLGSIIAYANLLYARDWRIRSLYGLCLSLCLVSVYVTLQNSWWVEIGVALLVMTLIYSRRLFLCYCAAIVPFFPLLLTELNKLQQVKSDDYGRFIIWQDTLRVWSKQPWLGVGPGNLWNYDQTFTQLPQTLRNFSTAGLGVAHNGYLQVLGELGLIGLFFWLAMIFVVIITIVSFYRRSNTTTARNDRILALVGLGLIFGSAAADFFSGNFFLPPRQVGGFNDLPMVGTTWIIFGCIAYKDQLWRMSHKRLAFSHPSFTRCCK